MMSPVSPSDTVKTLSNLTTWVIRIVRPTSTGVAGVEAS